jgi:methylated-DNA-protein-cysteine methyltransferase related protein
MVQDPFAKIYAVVRRIPPGRVASYGQVARVAGLKGYARQVGYAMAALSADSDVPWHRVVNAEGAISKRAIPDDGLLQRMLLEDEGVEFDEEGRVMLERYGWRTRRRS